MKKLALTIVSAVAISGAAFAQNINWASANGISAAAFSAQTNTMISPLFGGGAAGTVGNTGAATAGFTGNNAYFYELLYAGPNSGAGSWSGSQISGASAPSNTLSGATGLLSGGWGSSGLQGTNSANHFATPISPNSAAAVPWGTSTTNNIIMVGWSADLGLLGTGIQNWNNISNILANWTTTFQSQATPGLNYFFGVSTAGFLATSASNPGANAFATSASAFGTPINGLNTQLYLLPVPEPGTLALAGLGGISLLLFRRRKV
jgi:hypothetical protein